MFKYTLFKSDRSDVGLDEFIRSNIQKAEDLQRGRRSLSQKCMPCMIWNFLISSVQLQEQVPVSITFHLDKCADKGIVVFNTPGANANGVKELVCCRYASCMPEIL